MRIFTIFCLFFLSCGNPRGVPIQVLDDNNDKQAIAEPMIAELNKLAGCQWVYGAGPAPFKDNAVKMLLDTKLIVDTRKAQKDEAIVGYYDGFNIVMQNKVTATEAKDWPWLLDEEKLVFLHELGHAVGFEHSESETSWMYKNLSYTLSPHDAAQQFVSAMGGRLGMWTVCDRVRAAEQEWEQK